MVNEHVNLADARSSIDNNHILCQTLGVAIDILIALHGLIQYTSRLYLLPYLYCYHYTTLVRIHHRRLHFSVLLFSISLIPKATPAHTNPNRHLNKKTAFSFRAFSQSFRSIEWTCQKPTAWNFLHFLHGRVYVLNPPRQKACRRHGGYFGCAPPTSADHVRQTPVFVHDDA